ncbi:MAG: hypothetical protein ABUL69_00780, partial [Peristeroidobacter soli]
FLGTACSSDVEGTYQRPKIWPKATEPPPASPIYHEIDEWIPSEDDIAREAADHNALLAAEVEKALSTTDIVRRETVFVHIVPELLQVEPQRLIDLHAGLEPGPQREMLRAEMAAQWTNSDPVTATRWMKSLESGERREAAVVAVTSLAFHDPRAALALADEFEIQHEEPVRRLMVSLRKAAGDSSSN